MAEPNPEFNRLANQRRSKRNFIAVMATSAAGIALTALGLGRVISKEPTSTDPTPIQPPKPSSANDGDRLSPALRAKIDEQKAAVQVKNAEEERKINDQIQAYQDGLTDTAMIGATPLPTKTTVPAPQDSISTAVDGVEAKPTPAGTPEPNISPFIDGFTPGKQKP